MVHPFLENTVSYCLSYCNNIQRYLCKLSRFSCVDVKIYHSDDIDKYHCPKCAQTYGPSVCE